MMPISQFRRAWYFVERRAQHSAQFELADRGFEALFEARAADLFEVAVDGVAIGHGELAERDLSTLASLRLQRSAISMVRCNDGGRILEEQTSISSALLTKNWSLSKRKRSLS